jgi:hypothetical protein
MKMKLLRVFAVAVVATLAAGAHAQTLDSLVVTVTFDFMVGNTTLPAGTYNIDRALYNVPQSLALRSTDGHFSAIASGAVSGAGPALLGIKPKLVFNQYGNQYFLHEIRTNGGVHQLSASQSELKLARTLKPPKVATSGY